ncbi:MAG: terpene cyclase/mutase family protein [Chloroflexi bacterium]|nr:terpene cyclase/mutase family protein [Chloroflexota bacterium]MCI0579577.1 terpene cyclase/mutase family protein [Chloroflexota bacterium]MCI0644332.1 terpene cyclase/mutase family protein [Chloroflexota bacterium]MCI0725135.1 terpene cyclase/mutase family protein [Chloroflexota bacterium]
MNIASAVEFVNRTGNESEKARLRYILFGEIPAGEVVNGLLAGQRPDGGWPPFWAPDYSSVDATCFRLAQAEQLGVVAAHPAVGRAVQFLLARQRQDGSWAEDESVQSLAPPWATPGDLAARLYLTANGGFWLGMLAENREAARRAAYFLRSHVASDGRLPGFLQAHWLAAGLWSRVGWDEVAQPTLAYLETRLSDMAAGSLAWLVTALISAGVRPGHSLLAGAGDRLMSLQSEDGRWPGEDGAGQDVQTTLEALRALKWSGRI